MSLLSHCGLYAGGYVGDFLRQRTACNDGMYADVMVLIILCFAEFAIMLLVEAKARGAELELVLKSSD